MPANTWSASRDSMPERIDQNPPKKAGAPNAWQHVLTKPLPCQRGHKMHLKICSTNPSHASEDTKGISKCVDQTHPCQREKGMHLYALTKPSHSSKDIKMNFNSCLPNPAHESKATNCLSIYGYQTYPNAARTQNVSQIVLTKYLPARIPNVSQFVLTERITCQRGY